MRIEGRCWKVGDNVPTDQIVKSNLVIRAPEALAAYVLEDVHPRFAKEVQPGDILVAGRHFGQSSGRAIATKALQATGIGMVVAESFARTFYRNGFEIGLPIMECPGITDLVEEGQRLVVDLESGRVENMATDERLDSNPVDPFLAQMLAAGGLIEMVRSRGERWASTLADETV